MEIIDLLVQIGTKRRRGRKLLKKGGVTIHNVGNKGSTANARNNATYQQRSANDAVNGWHFTVDETGIYRSIPEDEIAEHSGKRLGNDTTVAIEICDNEGGDSLAATNNGAELAAYLLKQRGFTRAVWRENIFQHYDWSGKDCPAQIRRGIPYDWNTFVTKVNEYMGANVDVTAPPQPAPQPQYEFALSQIVSTKSGTREEVRAVQRTLNDYGYGLATDGIFGSKTKAAVIDFQRKRGLSADGIVGKKTCEALNGRWDG